MRQESLLGSFGAAAPFAGLAGLNATRGGAPLFKRCLPGVTPPTIVNMSSLHGGAHAPLRQSLPRRLGSAAVRQCGGAAARQRAGGRGRKRGSGGEVVRACACQRLD